VSLRLAFEAVSGHNGSDISDSSFGVLKMAKGSADNTMERSPWMCHICDYKSAETESQACELCFRVTCPLHLRPASIYNTDNGLYVTAMVCIACGSKTM